MTEATTVKTKQYEGMFILDATLAGKHWEKAKVQLTELLETAGLEIIRMEKWEERKLAYEIDRHKRGVFVLCFFRAGAEQIQKLKKACKMAEWVLRELILTHSGEVTDEVFRKPRARERDREESRRSSKGSRKRGPAEKPAPKEDAPASKEEASAPQEDAPAPKEEASATKEAVPAPKEEAPAAAEAVEKPAEEPSAPEPEENAPAPAPEEKAPGEGGESDKPKEE